MLQGGEKIMNDFKETMRETMDAMKDAVSCVQVANSLGLGITKSGDRCPSFIHNGKNPTSVVIYDDFWRSFSDDIGGDVIDLVAHKLYGGNKADALKWLSSYTGIPLPNSNYTDNWYKEIDNLTCQIAKWHEQLTPEHYEYLHNRRMTDKTINDLLIGYNPRENRIIIPMYKNNYVCYYCGRTMGEVTKTNPKYKKPKLNDFLENSLYGLQTLSKRKDVLVVAEGAFDYLSFYQEDFAVIANAGGTYSPQQTLEMLNIARGYDTVLLTFDNDVSGSKFTLRMAQQLFKRHINFKICNLPKQYKDISDYYVAGNNLNDLIDTAYEGIPKMCQLFAKPEAFEEFIIENRRYIKRTDIIAVFDILTADNIFPDVSKEWLKEVKKQALMPPNDDEITKAVLSKHKFKYNPSLGIYEYNRHYWKQLNDDTVKKYISDEYGKYRTASKIASVLALIKAETVTDEVPNQKNLINFINGTLDVENKKLNPHSANDFLTYELSYPYNPNVYSHDWDKFISSLFDDPKKEGLLQEYAGYILYPENTLQVALYLVGNGSNGKSVFLNLISKVFGNEANCSSVELTSFADKFQLIYLMGKRLNISNETKSDSMNAETNFKSVVAGDPIQACYKGKDFIQFKPKCKLIFGCNELPKSRDLTDGFTRRMLICSFPYQFKEHPKLPHEKPIDKGLEKRLSTPENLTGIFNWVYDGYTMLKQFNEFTEPDDQLQIMEDYKETQNPIVTFAKEFKWELLQYYKDEAPHMVPVDFMTNQQLLDYYKQWASKNNYVYTDNMRSFKKKFTQAVKDYRQDIECNTKYKDIRGIKRKVLNEETFKYEPNSGPIKTVNV